MNKRTIIIGDVHGCNTELELLLNKLDLKKEDDLYFVGDLINKGPESLKVLKIVKNLNAKAVMGNHETRFLKFVKDPIKGEMSYKLYEEIKDNFNFWIEYISSFPFYIETEDFILAHAGVSPIHKLQDTSTKLLATIRTWDGKGDDLQDKSNPNWYEFYNNDKLVVYGHNAALGLNIRKNTIGLDSGCVYGNQLSALIVETREVVSVQALKAYAIKD